MKPVMQPRCPNCLTEHPGPAVWTISHGQPCPACGHAQIFEEIDDYRAALRAARQRRQHWETWE